MTHPRVLLRTTSWVGGLLAALVGLVSTGDRLAPPPWPAPDASVAWDWLHRTDPAVATFSILRLAALAVVVYLLVSTLVLLATRLVRVPGLTAFAARATVPAARRLVQHATGLGLVVALAGTAGPVVAGATPTSYLPAATAAPFASRLPDPSTDPAPTSTLVPPAPASPSRTSAPVLRALPDEPTLVHLGPTPSATTAPSPAATAAPLDPTMAPATTTTTTTTSAAGAPSAAPPVEDPAPTATTGPGRPDSATTTAPPEGPDGPDERAGADGREGIDEHHDRPPAPGRSPGPMVVVPDPTPAAVGSPTDGAVDRDALATLDRRHHTIVSGDHLWGVAERTLSDRTGHAPTPAEVLDYLERLVAENRGVLAVPDNPDLVFPGQVFVLPA